MFSIELPSNCTGSLYGKVHIESYSSQCDNIQWSDVLCATKSFVVAFFCLCSLFCYVFVLPSLVKKQLLKGGLKSKQNLQTMKRASSLVTQFDTHKSSQELIRIRKIHECVRQDRHTDRHFPVPLCVQHPVIGPSVLCCKLIMQPASHWLRCRLSHARRTCCGVNAQKARSTLAV